jgi:hypothetical protein
MNKPIYHTDLEQGSPEWLLARLGIITASQVCRLITGGGKIADNNDSRSIVFEKLAERLTGRAEENISNKHMERGHVFEVVARDFYSEKIAPVSEVGFITRHFDDPDLPDGYRIGFSPDGLIGDDGIAEIKSPARTKFVKEFCENKPPDAYALQCHTGMLVTGRTYCDYIGIYNGMHMRTWRIHEDLEIQEKIKEAAKNLEVCILKQIALYKKHTADMFLVPFIEEVLVD